MWMWRSRRQMGWRWFVCARLRCLLSRWQVFQRNRWQTLQLCWNRLVYRWKYVCRRCLWAYRYVFGLLVCVCSRLSNYILASFEDFDLLDNGGSNCGEPIDTDIGVYWRNVDITDGRQAVFRVDRNGATSPRTGPTVDHTLGTSTGKYIYVEASSPCNPYVPWHFESTIRYDGASASSSLSFWYHQVSFDQFIEYCVWIR